MVEDHHGDGEKAWLKLTSFGSATTLRCIYHVLRLDADLEYASRTTIPNPIKNYRESPTVRTVLDGVVNYEGLVQELTEISNSLSF